MCIRNVRCNDANPTQEAKYIYHLCRLWTSLDWLGPIQYHDLEISDPVRDLEISDLVQFRFGPGVHSYLWRNFERLSCNFTIKVSLM